MSEQDSRSEVPSPLNLNSFLALLTLAGGIWLVSQSLTSNRPVIPAGETRSFIGDQTLEARLWEDPFKNQGKESGNNGSVQTQTNFDTLKAQIRERCTFTNSLLLLPVMLSGGQYSEDQESRIRSRYAVVSALGQSGFVPEDAEHIGTLRNQWPTQHEIYTVRMSMSNELSEQIALGTNDFSRMDLRYEWYRRREFCPQTANSNQNVLLLWLDDSFFEDDPLLRLALLLDPLIGTNDLTTVSLIGPRRSSTLRAMLQGLPLGSEPLAKIANQSLWPWAKKVFQRIDIFCATPSAMDEVLVTNNCAAIPRTTVKMAMENGGFNSFHNFAPTDSQLAKEVIEELALQGTDVSNTDNHVVLISEWDTFYGRILSLTYAAELTARQAHQTNFNRVEFVQGYIHHTRQMPTNLHSFVYLRGLDGQTVGENSATGSGTAENKDTAKKSPSSIEDIRSWVPDANKAEGQAQFDYLSRLGGQLASLEMQLRDEQRGHIKAIGIVGSDVYDTLLILQALRPQFPEVIFFTTDLDARFSHPRERGWARDLLVVSGYGLTLHPDLQQGVARFRDSTQTAQFAAALAGLGNTNLIRLEFVPPRRFEIGNHRIVDLSVSNSWLPLTGIRVNVANSPWLHPLTASESYRMLHPKRARHYLWLSLVPGFAIVMIACCLVVLLWRFKKSRLRFSCEALDYSEEDVGGPEGVKALLQRIREINDPVCKWMRQQLPTQFCEPYPISPEAQPINSLFAYFYGLLTGEGIAKKAANQQKFLCAEEKHLAEQTKAFVVLLNRLLREGSFLGHVASETNPSLRKLDIRQLLDKFLDDLTLNSRVAALETAVFARKATQESWKLGYSRIICLVIVAIVFGAVALCLGHRVWSDTFKVSEGEPFSLTSGVSAWPVECLRLVVITSAFFFSVGLYYQMNEAFLMLTRKFRLPLLPRSSVKCLSREQILSQLFYFFRSVKISPPAERICVARLWNTYRENGQFWLRLIRIVLPLFLYIVIWAGTYWLFDSSSIDTVRGLSARNWGKWLNICAGLSFLVLALFTIDAALLCRQFILEVSSDFIDFPDATNQKFSRQWGNIGTEYLNGWIGLQLIGELTERIGRLVYYPAGLLFVLELARNGWWDRWTWPPPLIFIFVFNLGLALASVVILQRTAKSAKRKAEKNLTAKVKQLRAGIAPSAEQNDADQAENLLQEMRQLRHGAFVSFWENPVVSTVFVSSGGMTALQVLIWFMGR